jgi:sortase A
VREYRHWPYAAVLVTAAFLSAGLAARAAWIPLKADLAQWLIERSWRQTLAGNAAPPWPWADTRAAAVLTAPRLEERLVVLAGSSGRNLAFGPVLLDGTGGLTGDVVISGHRDTHFRFLEQLRPGDRLQLAGPAGSRRYVVSDLEVVDSSRQELVIDPGVERLSLVTCYPFDSPRAGGPLRYVVTAYPMDF